MKEGLLLQQWHFTLDSLYCDLRNYVHEKGKDGYWEKSLLLHPELQIDADEAAKGKNRSTKRMSYCFETLSCMFSSHWSDCEGLGRIVEDNH